MERCGTVGKGGKLVGWARREAVRGEVARQVEGTGGRGPSGWVVGWLGWRNKPTPTYVGFSRPIRVGFIRMERDDDD